MYVFCVPTIEIEYELTDSLGHLCVYDKRRCLIRKEAISYNLHCIAIRASLRSTHYSLFVMYLLVDSS